MRKRLLDSTVRRSPVTEPPGALLLAIKQGAVLVLDITGGRKQDILPPGVQAGATKSFSLGAQRKPRR